MKTNIKLRRGEFLRLEGLKSGYLGLVKGKNSGLGVGLSIGEGPLVID